MEVVNGIILCFSENINAPTIPTWKKIIVSCYTGYEDRESNSTHLMIKCENESIYGIKRLALSLKKLFSMYIICEGVLVVYGGIQFIKPQLATFLRSEKEDFIGYGPGIPSIYKPSQEDLTESVDDHYLLELYHDFSFPLYPFTRRPKIGGVSGTCYLSKKSCRIVFQHMEGILYDVFTYDTHSSSYPYFIENCALSYIMYRHDTALSVSSFFNFSSTDCIARGTPNTNLSLTIPTSGTGFFSNCNTRLIKIIEFFNKNHVLPEKINCVAMFKWYKPEKYNRDIVPFYFQTKTDTIPYVQPISIVDKNCHDEDQFCDYHKYIQYEEVSPFIKVFFQLTQTIQWMAQEIIKKYHIDFSQTCVLFYRGNDKINETKLCPYEEVIEKAKKVNEKYPDIRFMIQSDETAFITTMMETFPNAFYCRDEIRHMGKRNDTTVDYEFKSSTHEFSKKFLAITWIMSQCKYVVSGSSGNCLLWITYYRGNASDICQYLNGEWIDNIPSVFTELLE